VAERAGLPKVNGKGKLDFHSLRTSFINLLIALGVDPKTVQGMARHETIGQTMDVYGRIRNEMMKEAAEKLGALFNKSSCQPQSSRQIHAKSDGEPISDKNATA